MLLTTLLVSASLLPQGESLGGLAAAPRGPIATLVVADPGRALGDVFAELANSNFDPDDPDRNWLDVCERFGVRSSDPTTWQNTGFDLSRPARVSIAHPGSFLGLPETVWLVAAVTDRERVHEFLSACEPDAERRGDSKPVVHASDSVAWCVRGGEVIVLGSAAAQVSAGARLLRVLEQESSVPTIGSDPLFRIMAKRVTDEVLGSLYVDLHSIDRVTRVRAVLATLTGRGMEVVLGCKDHRWIDATRPGGTAREMLARFDQPAIAFSVSLADPFAVLDELSDAEHAQVTALAPRLLSEDMHARLENTALGVAIYPRGGKFDNPRFAACLRSSSAMQIFADLAAAAEGETSLERDGDWLEGDYLGRDLIIGRTTDFVVFGDAIDEIRRGVRAKQDAWRPVVGGRDLLAAQFDTLALGLADKDAGDAERLVALEQAGTLALGVAANAEGFALSVRFEGAKGDESFLRRLIRAIRAVN